jgi:hypothetical protein
LTFTARREYRHICGDLQQHVTYNFPVVVVKDTWYSFESFLPPMDILSEFVKGKFSNHF